MISKIETSTGHLNTLIGSPTIGGPLTNTGRPEKKSIGDAAPIIVDPMKYPELLPLLEQYGTITLICKKLKTLTRSRRKIKIALAKNTVAAADNDGVLYLGVDFLTEYKQEAEVLAGVVCHEFGHMLSDTAKYGNLNNLTWDEIFTIRREEEGSADAFAGRMLPMMGYSPEPLIAFLQKGEDNHGSHKYYDPKIRAEIIRQASKITQDRQKVSRQIFSKGIYTNPYNSILLISE